MSRLAIGESYGGNYIFIILTSCLLTLVTPTGAAGSNPQTRTPAPSESQTTTRRPAPAEAFELGPGSPAGQEIKGGETRAYSVALSEGQYVEVSVRQKGIDVTVRAFGPDGAKITEVDNDPEDGTEYVLVLADATGRYRLEVFSADKGAAAGSFEIKVEELREATERDRTRVRAARVFEAAEQLRALQTAESLRKSIDSYNEALPLWREAGDKRGEAYTLNQIGLVRSRTGEPKKAIEFYEQAMALWRDVGDRLNEANELTNIGTAYWRQSESEKALEYNGRALSVARAAGYREVEALALNNIGAEYGASGQPQEALKYFGQALPLIGNQKLQAVTLNNMATDCIQLGEFQRAVEYLNRSLTLRRAVGDRRGEAITLHNIGRAYAELGEPTQALEYYNQALVLGREVGDHRGEAITLQSLSTVYISSGDLRSALDYSNKALELSRAMSDRRLEAYELNDLGMIYRNLGETQKALDQFNQALSVVRAVGEKFEEVSILNNIGDARLRSGDTTGAVEFHERALALSRETHSRPGEVSSLYGLARTLSQTGDLAQARSRIEAALEIVESTRTKVAGAELRTSYLASNKEPYQFYIDLLMSMHREKPSGGFDAAALQASERARARGLLDLLAEARADIRQGVEPELLARERSLQQQLNLKADRLTRLLGTNHTAEQEAAATKEVESLLSDYKDAESQIRARSPRYAALTQPQPLSAADIRKELDPDTALLEYSLGDERSFLWAVTQSSVAGFELPKRAEIESQARHVYELLTARDQFVKFETADQRRARIEKADAEYAASSAALSRLLLGPVADRIGRKRLLIVADGALQYLPFGALPLPDPAGGALPRHDFVPVIAEHEVVSLPSASTLSVLRKELAGRSPAPQTLMVFADPVFDASDERVGALKSGTAARRTVGAGNERGSTEDSLTRSLRDLEGDAEETTLLPRLPFTRSEAEAIAALAPSGRSEKLLDFAASRSAATDPRLGQYRYVHFATHVLLNTSHPELSGVVLSLVAPDGKEQDGFLRAHEIYNLNLDADLVALSGCRTGLGKEVSGEGLVGLTRGFMYAGAARVLVSLWDVDDRSTATLMERFYKGVLARTRVSPAAALRRAQLEMWRSTRWHAPYYWGAFVLQGEYR
jgi:CHAT domain-containing protein/tetratricopeptide (TPR) repeat protein